MEDNSASKYATSFGWALAVASVVNAVLVVIKEKSASVQAAMKKITGHHWTTHAALVVIVFLAVGLILPRLNRAGATARAGKVIAVVLSGVIAATAIIIGFYLIAD